MFENPNFHSNDPPGSKKAGRRVDASGDRERHALVVYRMVAAAPACTASELWYAADSSVQDDLRELQEVRRRLTDLLEAGCVARGPSRRCAFRKTTMVTWSVRAPFTTKRSEASSKSSLNLVLGTALDAVLKVGARLERGSPERAALAYVVRQVKAVEPVDPAEVGRLLGEEA